MIFIKHITRSAFLDRHYSNRWIDGVCFFRVCVCVCKEVKNQINVSATLYSFKLIFFDEQRGYRF